MVAPREDCDDGGPGKEERRRQFVAKLNRCFRVRRLDGPSQDPRGSEPEPGRHGEGEQTAIDCGWVERRRVIREGEVRAMT